MKLACWHKSLIAFLVYYALLFIGAAIIMYIEAEGLKSYPSNTNATEKLERLFNTEVNISLNKTSLEKILEISHHEARKMKNVGDRKWKRQISWSTFYKWRYFTQITLTTVGFGDIVPETDGGKIFVIIYSIIGIPVNLLVTTAIGFLLSESLSKLIRLVELKVLRYASCKKVEIKTFILLLVMSITWLTIGAGMTRRTMNWSWTEGFYAAFVKLSTIGYGDYTLDYNKMKAIHEVLSWYTNIGLALIAGLLDAVNRTVGDETEEGKSDSENDKGKCEDDLVEMNRMALKERGFQATA